MTTASSELFSGCDESFADSGDITLHVFKADTLQSLRPVLKAACVVQTSHARVKLVTISAQQPLFKAKRMRDSLKRYRVPFAFGLYELMDCCGLRCGLYVWFCSWMWIGSPEFEITRMIEGSKRYVLLALIKVRFRLVDRARSR